MKCPAYKKKCRKCQNEGHFARVCKVPIKKNSKVDALEQQNSSDEDHEMEHKEMHTYFGSVEIECVSNRKNNNKSMITVQIGKQDVKMKADTGAEATVIPYHLYKTITQKPLQMIHQSLKGWHATKPIHPKGCVRLSTQHKNRKIDLIYLVVEENFTPLLSCDACLDLEVLKFITSN